jgi:peptidoglycan-associated lipoprotein
MNKGTQQAAYATNTSAGTVGPVTQGPDRGMKEVMVVGGTVLLLAIGIGIAWMMASQSEPTIPATSASFPSTQNATLGTSAIETRGVQSATQPASLMTPLSARALPTQLKDSLHADIYFDFGKNRLSDEAKIYLDEHAAFMNKYQDYGLLIQGYTDGRGSALYNRALGLKRAEAVKAYLTSLGVSEHSIKTASLGEDGVLCLDDSLDCLTLNRRAHLEFIKVGAAHMVPPPMPAAADSTVVPSETVTIEPTAEPIPDSTDASIPMPPVESNETESQVTTDELGVTP